MTPNISQQHQLADRIIRETEISNKLLRSCIQEMQENNNLLRESNMLLAKMLHGQRTTPIKMVPV